MDKYLEELKQKQKEQTNELLAAQMTESRTGMQKHLTWLERQKVNLDPNPFRNIDPTEWQISPRRIKRLITEHRKSIFPLFGPAIAIALFMEEILNPDDIHLISLLIKDVSFYLLISSLL